MYDPNRYKVKSEIESSYAKNNFGELFQLMMFAYRPGIVVELGILNGYSTVHLAKGLLRTKDVYGACGHIYAYDLFDKYPYKHGNKELVEKMLEYEGVRDLVTIREGDAYEVYPNFENKRVEFLHVDISNTGDTVKRILKLWDQKLGYHSVVCFEGGSEERDNIEWMVKYNMPSIRQEIITNEFANKNYWYGIYEKFPSLSVLMRWND